MSKVIIFFIGLLIGVFLTLKLPSKTETDVDLAIARLEEFRQMEEICGKGNVSSKCNGLACNSRYGFTCYIWRKAAYESEK